MGNLYHNALVKLTETKYKKGDLRWQEYQINLKSKREKKQSL